ncbi:MAG: type II secretion system F family protein [Lachnospiraceae bacterium]|nr:type II secretion system F family protein [Lachnospiraceae bacterium]
MREQFKEWIQAAASELQAGSSVENAFVKAGRELRLLYGENADIRMEIRGMERLLDNNITFESILADFADRSNIEEICSFADAFAAGKRIGGDLREMIEGCCEIVVMKTDVEREIRTLLHGRQMEQRIMCFVPFAIVGYISLSTPGYFTPLYHNTAGICIMTVCMTLYLFAVCIGMRIVRIQV